LADSQILRQELEHIKNEKTSPELFAFIGKNIVAFFSTPDIPRYYQTLKDVDCTAASMLPKLIIAWLAFLSGDHAGLFARLNSIDAAELNGAQESSFYYALKALVSSMQNRQEGLRYARLSLEVLPKNEKSLYLANARLTYGQLLAGNDEYRAAAAEFAAAEKVFSQLGLPFPAVIALVNELLNRYKLGETGYVIEKCSQVLLMSGSFTEETPPYWNVVHLPLGMCYYELGKPNLALEHLQLAKASIDQFSLFHMHGTAELYLFMVYYVLKDRAGMERVKAEAEARFGQMHYRQIDLLLALFRILAAEDMAEPIIRADIERFELEYAGGGADSPATVLDGLVYLQLKGLSDTVRSGDLAKRLARFRYTGHIPRVQMTLLQLAELCFQAGRREDAREYWQEAVEIYKEFGISACFYTLPLKSVEILQRIDKKLYSRLSISGQNVDRLPASGLLSVRERDIMQLIAAGKTNGEMSEVLFISVGTIKWHINHIFSKLEVKNRVQAIEKAKRLGEII